MSVSTSFTIFTLVRIKRIPSYTFSLSLWILGFQVLTLENQVQGLRRVSRNIKNSNHAFRHNLYVYMYLLMICTEVSTRSFVLRFSCAYMCFIFCSCVARMIAPVGRVVMEARAKISMGPSFVYVQKDGRYTKADSWHIDWVLCTWIPDNQGTHLYLNVLFTKRPFGAVFNISANLSHTGEMSRVQVQIISLII